MSRPKYLSSTVGADSQQVQQQLVAALGQLSRNPLLAGQLLESLTLTTGANTVNHKLGRKVKGYIVTSCSASATFYDNIASAGSTTTFTLTASAAATVSLWVF